MHQRFFSCQQIAIYLGLSEKTIRRKVDHGELPVIRIGRSLRIDMKELEQKLEAQKGGLNER